MTPQRYAARAVLPIAADDGGDLVRFADIEPALRDQRRLQWLLPVIGGPMTSAARQRAQALEAGRGIGLGGEQLVDWAMEGCP